MKLRGEPVKAIGHGWKVVEVSLQNLTSEPPLSATTRSRLTGKELNVSEKPQILQWMVRAGTMHLPEGKSQNWGQKGFAEQPLTRTVKTHINKKDPFLNILKL